MTDLPAVPEGTALSLSIIEVNKMTEIICAVVAAAATIICAFIASSSKKASDKAEARGELRRKESLLSLRMIDACMQLAIVSANALTNGHNNGNVERARAAAQEAAEEYKKFMEEVTSHEVSK